MLKRTGLLLGVLVLSGCATPKATVLRFESGVVAQYNADSAEEAEKVTIKAAREYCGNRDGDVVVVTKESFYKGSMNETVNHVLSKAGSVIPVVGWLADDEPYTSKLTFRCK
jgi:hypothetical protein